jgi:flagellar biogenesis protein FliO
VNDLTALIALVALAYGLMRLIRSDFWRRKGGDK